jgi:hypothetical protein
MSPLGASARSNRVAFLFLILTLVVVGLEIWGIRAALGTLLR